jgi:hypothetical protein
VEKAMNDTHLTIDIAKKIADDPFFMLFDFPRGDMAKRLAQVMGDNVNLRQAFNPRIWSREMSDAWHKALPDTQAAFEALLKASEYREKENNHE